MAPSNTRASAKATAKGSSKPSPLEEQLGKMNKKDLIAKLADLMKDGNGKASGAVLAGRGTGSSYPC
jgi:hypothetical protein